MSELESVKLAERYREAGYQYRHYCGSRIAVLGVTLPTVYGVLWILLSSGCDANNSNVILARCESKALLAYALAAFGIIMMIISVVADHFYASRANAMFAKMGEMENGSTVPVMSGLTTDARQANFGDRFTICVYSIIVSGLVMLGIIFVGRAV